LSHVPNCCILFRLSSCCRCIFESASWSSALCREWISLRARSSSSYWEREREQESERQCDRARMCTQERDRDQRKHSPLVTLQRELSSWTHLFSRQVIERAYFDWLSAHYCRSIFQFLYVSPSSYLPRDSRQAT